MAKDKPKLTRAKIFKAVSSLYINRDGQKATRLMLVDDLHPGSNLGCWGKVAMTHELCKLLLEVKDRP